MTIERVVVDVDFGVESNDFAGRRCHQRIDFCQGAVAFHEAAIELLDDLGSLIGSVRIGIDFVRQFARLIALNTEDRIDVEFVDFFWGLGSDFFDIDAAFG